MKEKETVFEKYGINAQHYEKEIEIFLQKITKEMGDPEILQEVVEEEIRKMILLVRNDELGDSNSKVTEYELKVFLFGMVIGQLFKEIHDRMAFMHTMDGFNPLGGLKEWHVWLTLLLAGCGIIGLIVWIVKGIIWIFNHVQII